MTRSHRGLDALEWPRLTIKARRCCECGERFEPRTEHQIRCTYCAAANA